MTVKTQSLTLERRRLREPEADLPPRSLAGRSRASVAGGAEWVPVLLSVPVAAAAAPRLWEAPEQPLKGTLFSLTRKETETGTRQMPLVFISHWLFPSNNSPAIKLFGLFTHRL